MQSWVTSASATRVPGFGTTTAQGVSPQSGSGMPKTADLSVAPTSASCWPWGIATASMRGATTVSAASGVAQFPWRWRFSEVCVSEPVRDPAIANVIQGRR